MQLSERPRSQRASAPAWIRASPARRRGRPQRTPPTARIDPAPTPASPWRRRRQGSSASIDWRHEDARPEESHDATTLGGNSGSVMVDLASGEAIGLQFGGIEGERDSAVQAARVRELVVQLAS